MDSDACFLRLLKECDLDLDAALSAVDIVKTARGCGAPVAKGVLWRILREHWGSEGELPPGFSAGPASTIVCDAPAACELLCLVPGSTASSRLRSLAVAALLRDRGWAPRSRAGQGKARRVKISRARALLAAALWAPLWGLPGLWPRALRSPHAASWTQAR